ncbi:MAG: alpha/beta hydrolase [Thermosynechococcaceae cyanobacterium]
MSDRSTSDGLQGRTVSVRRGVDLQVCYHSGRLPALVFLHGGLGNRLNWRSQYEFACAQGWAAIAYDLAGHGQSAPYPRYSIGRHCRDLTRLLHRFGIQSPVLCCHSYGVPIGLEWAQRHPTSALILIAGGTHELDPWWEIPLMKVMTWGGRYLFRLPIAQQWARALSSSHRHPVVERFFAESPIPVDFHSYKALEIFWKYDFFARAKTDHYRNIPTLVITGGRDAMFRYGMGEQLAAHFYQGQHLHFSEAGHIVMAEYSEAVNKAIAHWLTNCGLV